MTARIGITEVVDVPALAKKAVTSERLLHTGARAVMDFAKKGASIDPKNAELVAVLPGSTLLADLNGRPEALGGTLEAASG